MAEFTRIMSEDMEQVFQDKWGELEEKVIKIAEEEHDNELLQALLETSGQTDLPTGKSEIMNLVFT